MIENAFTFIFTGSNECPHCGISSFSHHHKAGSLPKDFVKIIDPSDGPKPLTDSETQIIEMIKEIVQVRIEEFRKEIREDKNKGLKPFTYASGAKVGSLIVLETILDDIDDNFDIRHA